MAQLEFAVGDSVLFESFDPSLSTDSLDSNELRERCQVRKDDFQLAFADSGHWQSGINANLTTWGRIRTVEAFDEKTASAPEVQLGGHSEGSPARKSASSYNNRNSEPNHNATRTTSLLANFVDRNSDISARYVDVNDNEVTATALLTQDEQRARSADRWQKPPVSNRPVTGGMSPRSAPVALRNSPRAGPVARRRTFADLQKNTPELDFLALQHEVHRQTF